MSLFSRRCVFASALVIGFAHGTSLFAADKPKEIFVDWATYNPVSMLLKEKGLLEKEFAKDAIKATWVKTVSSSNAPITVSGTYRPPYGPNRVASSLIQPPPCR